MGTIVAHLGPKGTNAEAAALAYTKWLHQKTGQECCLRPYPSIAQSIRAAAEGQAHLAVVPVENSLEGSVTMTLDTLWQLDGLQIRHALVLPIVHALLSCAEKLTDIRTVYSHPQALAQCQGWLSQFLPWVQVVPTNSTTDAIENLEQEKTAGAISSQRAAQLYNVPILASAINDNPDNCTRFWVLSLKSVSEAFNFGENQASHSHTSLAFSVPANMPGALAKPLLVFANRNINLSRIESRPTKRSLGEYLFFIDIEADANEPFIQAAIAELAAYTETLKIFGSYSILPI
ncbi:prephenate dehydratase [Microseira sp. BLCC-F43]|jgi:prephenate dehydratase|uniref:prephenate dehydratase n=1 Tax=Microseira sp. BLCC-F43 TaxID=3153602 RepID=UPI0035B82F52